MNHHGQHHILEIDDFSITFTQYEKGLRQIELPVISHLHASVHAGEIVAVVGASGSGKSLLGNAILGLFPPNARVAGTICLDEQVMDLDGLQRARGHCVALVPQGVDYLDPLMKVGKQVRGFCGDKAADSRRAEELFKRYDLDARVGELYPFELSGGMARRVLLACALMGDPWLIVADEPTPGLHLEMAKRAMEDFRSFANDGGGVLLITHDIELALSVADRIAVFYAGTTVEEARAEDFAHEETLRHPFSRALWRALPSHGFETLAGNQPYVKHMPPGCPFGPRCEYFDDACMGDIPVHLVDDGTVRCVHARRICGAKDEGIVHAQTHVHERGTSHEIHTHSVIDQPDTAGGGDRR